MSNSFHHNNETTIPYDEVRAWLHDVKKNDPHHPHRFNIHILRAVIYAIFLLLIAAAVMEMLGVM